MSARRFVVHGLLESQWEQLMDGQPLPAGNYNLSMWPNGEELFDVHLDGVPLRTGLDELTARRVLANLRDALRMDWKGKGGR